MVQFFTPSECYRAQFTVSPQSQTRLSVQNRAGNGKPYCRVIRPKSNAGVRLQRDSETAGGHRPHCGRLRQAEKGGGAEFFGAVSVSQREDSVVLRPCHAAVLSLLRMRRL